LKLNFKLNLLETKKELEFVYHSELICSWDGLYNSHLAKADENVQMNDLKINLKEKEQQ
jgi:hypothetical protein